MCAFRKNLRIFFGKLRSSKELVRIPKKILKFECYPGSLSHNMRALTAKSMPATRATTRAATWSVGLHGQEVHMGAHHLRLETASNQLLLQFAKH